MGLYHEEERRNVCVHFKHLQYLVLVLHSPYITSDSQYLSHVGKALKNENWKSSANTWLGGAFIVQQGATVRHKTPLTGVSFP